MKPQTRFLVIAALTMLVLGTALLAYGVQPAKPLIIFPARVNRDCAPWDGAAFTVSIPYDAVSVINISIWQSPDFTFPTKFSLPDEEAQVGYASVLSERDLSIPLHGEILFQRVGEGMPIEGRFSLTSESGTTFVGRFSAEWGDQMALCG